MPKGFRTIIPNVYEDAYGISVRVGRGSGKARVTLESPRFPKGTPIDELRKVRQDLRDQLAIEKPADRRGTLGHAFEQYLETFPNGPRRRDESALLQHWRDAGFDEKARDGVTSLEVRQQLATFAGMKKADGSPRFTKATLNHLRRVLGAVYRRVNGKSGYNPVRDVPKLIVRYEEPRAIPYEVIEWIFAHMPDIGQAVKGTSERPGVSKTKIRLRVMAYTGLPPAQLARVQPRDLHLRTKEVFGRPRRKGEGVDGYRLPLTDAGVREFRQFVKHECFGRFSARTAARTWRKAVTRAHAAWIKAKRGPWPVPDDVRAYDLRHSFGSMAQLLTGDLQATADLLMHASLSTTRRYTKASVAPRMRDAAARLDVAFADLRPTGWKSGSKWLKKRQK